VTRHDQFSGTRGEAAWGRGWGCGARGRPRGLAAWRHGDKRAALRRGGGGARSGVTPCPFGACPSGFASAPAIVAYKGKPIDWTRMVQEMRSRRFIGWLTRHDRVGFEPLGGGKPPGGCRHDGTTWRTGTRARDEPARVRRRGGEHVGRACVGPGAGARGSTWGERAGVRGCPNGELCAPAGAGALGAGASSAGKRGA